MWSPEGGSLLFATGGLVRPGAVLRKRSDGIGPIDTLLRLSRGINGVLITRDSARFVLRLVGPPSRDIVLWQRGGDTTTPLLASPGYNEGAPALSPDGKWLAYQSDETGRTEV